MKSLKLIRATFLIAAVLFFIQKYISLKGFNGDLWVMNATKFFSNEELAKGQLKFFLWHKFLNYSLFILIVPLSHRFLFNKLDHLQRWWLALPFSLIISTVLGIVLAHIDRTINPTFFLSPFNENIIASSISLFDHLIIRNTIGFLNAFGIGALLFKTETLVSQAHISTKKGQWTYWFSILLIYLVTTLVLTSIVFANQTSGQVIILIPHSLILASFMTLSTAFFFSTFLKKGIFSLSNFGSKVSEFLFPSLGILGLFLFYFDHELAFGDRYLLSGWSIAILIMLILTAIVAVFSLTTFKLNLSNIRRDSQLNKNLKEKESQLSLLKSQINPHFLFNSLNTVYGLALEEESPKSAEGVQKLSEMMRFMLQENTADKIPLDREIKYINDYIDFQRLRIADKENIKLDIEIATGCEGQISPMLLIPMIENAFKHGISMSEPSWIKISLTCGQNDVQLKVENSMHPKTGQKSEESGIGLENVRKRLEILYPEKHLFQVFENTESFEANIKVTLS